MYYKRVEVAVSAARNRACKGPYNDMHVRDVCLRLRIHSRGEDNTHEQKNACAEHHAPRWPRRNAAQFERNVTLSAMSAAPP